MSALDPWSRFRTELSCEGRTGDRDSLLLMAAFRVAGATEWAQVRVRNLSEGGLMAELPVAIEVDTRVEMEVRGIGRIDGRVAWYTAGRTGIAFDRLVDPKIARKPVGKGEQTPVYTKPILTRG